MHTLYIFLFIFLGAVVSSTTSIETAPTSTHQHTSNATNQVQGVPKIRGGGQNWVKFGPRSC